MIASAAMSLSSFLVVTDAPCLRIVHASVGTEAMATLPWSLVPSVFVPFFLIAHAIVRAQHRERMSKATTRQMSSGRLSPAR
jgi:hypothetical protein